MDDDLVLRERRLELAHDAGVERPAPRDGRAVARVALGREHLDVCAPEQLLGRRAVGGEEGPADRGVDLDDAAVDPVRPAQRMA